MQELFSVRGKKAIVTGGTRGIGYMIAEGLLAAGAEVFISSRKADACEEVAAAIQDAIDRGALGFDAIKLLTLCRIEQRPAQLDLSGYPYLTKAVVKTTAASDCLALVPGRAA